MPIDYKKRPELSAEMADFKEKLHQQALDNRLALKQAHKAGTVLSSIVDGITNFGNMAFQSVKEFPVVGFGLRMVGVGLNSLVIILDPKKPLKDKILPLIFLSIVTGLSIAAFVVGALFAAAVGTALSAVMTLVEGVMLGANAIEMNRVSKAYDKRKIFEKLVDSKIAPEEGNDPLFAECHKLFAVRHAELKEVLRRNCLKPDDQVAVREELDYLNSVINKTKNISLTQNSVIKLNGLYLDRETKLNNLATVVATLKEKSDKGDDTSQEIDSLEQVQRKLIKIDNDILKITPSAKQLKLDKLKAKEEFFYSLGNLGMALAGLALSITALLMITSVAGTSVVVPASPILTGIVAVGMVTTFVSFGKFVAETIAEHQDANELLKKETLAQEGLLEEALYKNQTQPQFQVPSYNAMKKIINSKPEEAPPEPTKDTSLNHESPEKPNLGKVQRPMQPLPEIKSVTVPNDTVQPEPEGILRPP